MVIMAVSIAVSAVVSLVLFPAVFQVFRWFQWFRFQPLSKEMSLKKSFKFLPVPYKLCSYQIIVSFNFIKLNQAF